MATENKELSPLGRELSPLEKIALNMKIVRTDEEVVARNRRLFAYDLEKYISRAKTKNELRDMSREFGWNYGTAPTATFDEDIEYGKKVIHMRRDENISLDEMKEYILETMPKIYITDIKCKADLEMEQDLKKGMLFMKRIDEMREQDRLKRLEKRSEKHLERVKKKNMKYSERVEKKKSKKNV